jgi:hypothetical protein
MNSSKANKKTVNCYCCVPTKQIVALKEGDNQNRSFHACAMRMYDSSTKTSYGGCNFFHWTDVPMHKCEVCERIKIKTKAGGFFCASCAKSHDSTAYLRYIKNEDWNAISLHMCQHVKEAPYVSYKAFQQMRTHLITLTCKVPECEEKPKLGIMFHCSDVPGKPENIAYVEILHASVNGKIIEELIMRKLDVRTDI